MPEFDTERATMVRDQIVGRGVLDRRVIAAFRKIERHRFVAGSLAAMAYDDTPLPIGEDQTISQPYMAALMTEALELTGRERVLEVGTGSGYQTAILLELANEVYTIERISALAARAAAVLTELGFTRFHCRTGDGSLGWREESPFDRIIVTAGSPDIPASLLDQLSIGGRMVIPVGDAHHQTLTVVRKGPGHHLSVKDLGGCVFVPLVGKEGWRR